MSKIAQFTEETVWQMPNCVQHPGEILKRELAELGVSPSVFAHQISVPPNRISQIITGKRSVTGDTALRFGHWFGGSPDFWMNLQSKYDLALAEQRAGDAVRDLPTAADGSYMRAGRRARNQRDFARIAKAS